MSPTGGIDIDIPGVRRAYGDITIRPKLRKLLAIPMRREAFGMKPTDFTDAFVVKSKKSGNEFIARNQGGQLVYLFSLVKSVFQRKDSGIMPSDKTFTRNIVKRICRYLDFAK